MLGKIIESIMGEGTKKHASYPSVEPGVSGPPGRNYGVAPGASGPPGRNYGSSGEKTNERAKTSTAVASAKPTAAAPQVEDGPSASDTLASISRDELKNYLEKYGKTEEELLADTNSTALIDGARESQVLGQQVSKGMQQRTMSRYGANMTPAQQAAQQRMSSLGNASSYAGAVNNATIDQRDRNFGLKASLMGMGKEQLSVAMDGLGNAAGMEASREAAYQRDKAAAHASNMSMIGSIIGFGL